MSDPSLMPSQDFRLDEDKPAIAELNRFLRPYDLTKSLNDLQDEDGKLDLGDVIDRLPERTEDGINPAHKELHDYYYAIPLKMRTRGVRMRPGKILSALMDRLEFFSSLKDFARVCKGYQCEHYDVCPFSDIVGDNRKSDQIPCIVDRQVIQGAIDNYVTPEDGKPKVDPRRPVMATLFEQLVQLLVKQKWISLSMKSEDVLADHYEVLQDGQTEHFESRNQVEHPLMKAWDRNHKRIEKVLDKMGITPQFEIRQDLWESEDARTNAEERSKQLLWERVQDALKSMESEDDQRSQLISEALRAVRDRTEDEIEQ